MAGAVCGVCDAPVRPPFRAPPQELSPDLDLRPGEPTRSTLPRWVQTCRDCGASGPDLAALPASASATLESPAYAALRRPGPDAAFLRWALIAQQAGDQVAAAEATLQAAWALDDKEQDASALRRQAASLWGLPGSVESVLRLVDVLRRAGEWDRAAETVAEATRHRAPLDSSSAAILAFQQARIAEHDRGRYLISSALRPPARTPHVAHHRPVPNLWQRLFTRR